MISFAIPWALLGLVAAGLPLLLHLVQRRDAPEIDFPAVRYLADAARAQNRRLRFRHWLLLVLRTLLIVALVFAAAGASVRRSSIGPHAPGALAMVFDNAAASGAVVDGEPLLAGFARAAGRVLDRATPADRLWLIAADGIPRAGTAAELRQHLAELHPDPVRLDLGRAIGTARELVSSAGRPGEVVVVSGLQRSALSAAAGHGPLLVLRPTSPFPANHGVLALSAGTQPWTTAGGEVTVAIVSSDTVPVPVSLAVGGRVVRDVLVTPGVPMVQRISAGAPGWTTITASLPPDEFRLDDARTIALRVAPPVAVQWDSSNRYISAAAAVLAAHGRIRSGSGGVRFGSLGSGVSVVMPPEDPAAVGAVNRALAARGVSWQFGSPVLTPARLDSGSAVAAREAVGRRYQLERTGASGDVLATVDGAPWLVRDRGVLLLGSRLDPTWTGLPLSASFVPFVDFVTTAAARGTLITPDAVVGDVVTLPARVTALGHDGTRLGVTGGATWTPAVTGVFHLLAGLDTLGAISVRLDRRVSALTRATDREVRALWPGATVAELDHGPGLAFTVVGRGDLRGVLLVLALVCAVAETLIVGRARLRG